MFLNMLQYENNIKISNQKTNLYQQSLYIIINFNNVNKKGGR